MKKKEITELKNASVSELIKQIKEGKKELKTLELETHVKKPKNTRQAFHMRKKISVLLTVLNEKRKSI